MSLLALAFAVTLAGPAADSVRTDRDVRLTALRNARSVMRCYVDEGLRRQAELEGVVEVELTVEATWRRIGTLLPSFTPAECANYLVNSGMLQSEANTL